jgi:hypothetical protein
MRRQLPTAFVACTATLLATSLAGSAGPAGAQAPPPLVSQAQYDRWRVELSNWGRWGPDDEMGALNMITAD